MYYDRVAQVDREKDKDAIEGCIFLAHKLWVHRAVLAADMGIHFWHENIGSS